MLETFTVQTFIPHLNSKFHVFLNVSQWVEMELIEANELSEASRGGTPEEPGRMPFALLFRSPGEVYLPQRIYSMKHNEIGSFELFLVPIGPDGEGMRYEAIFA